MAFGDPNPSSSSSTSKAEGILRQIEGLLHQYLNLDNPPDKAETEAMLDSVRSRADQLKGEAESPKEDTAEGGESSEEGESSPTSFRDATAAARKAFGQNGNAGRDRGGSKTEDVAQTQDEEDKKKRTKAY